jgi:hypothetical protein
LLLSQDEVFIITIANNFQLFLSLVSRMFFFDKVRHASK